MEITTQFWKNKRVLITGHTGFKGSWITLWLSMMGSKVSGLALDPEMTPNMFDVLEMSSLVADTRGDIRDIDICKKVLKETSPDILIHMAAQPLVRESYIKPVRTFETNIIGTINILEAARNCDSLKTILVVTSDKCYENYERNYEYIETDPMGGFDPYSSSKGCAELVTASYRRSFFEGRMVGVATVRAGNVIGGGDWSSDRLIPDSVRAYNSKKKLTIRNPNAIRPWQHVLEPLSGYLLLCKKLWKDPKIYSGGWNFGPEKESNQTVGNISDRFAYLWGNSASWIINNDKELHEATLLQLNSNKAKNKLGWHPKWDWNIALEKTMEWYKEFFKNNQNIKDFTIKQISTYCEK